ncbi:DNA/RNA non-specific endonuclease [Myxococcus stipitatus DSM 14675]|uniref:DNA/RNA non-specific endonuclease n=1 Tax=Myxococcus stipitatus (strain DSM 14675 / JCM 12634 / Mx s8) TaxID=1278073 RepID=L7UIC5_MYXSD|nr:DNA/RNA non-specific endonuclease [Myxococcus stipitatus]AGC47307.1 DNA/RNA non-specific endonuclease [Myxococcus stipitatus DSM 14675]
MTTLRPTSRASTASTGSSADAAPVNGLKPKGGSWNRSATKEVSISDLQAKFGWTDQSWETGLLKAADASGGKTRGKNGKVSAAEIQEYLAAPTDGRYLSSTALQQGRAALDTKLSKGGGAPVKVDAFDLAWQDNLAKRADLLGGNKDGKVSQDELAAYIQKSKASQADGARWVPDQQMAVFQSRVAQAAGELDPLRPKGGEGKGMELVKQYSRLMLDEGKNLPTFVSHMLSAADIKETPADVHRDKSTFVRDPVLGSKGVTDADYLKTGFDRGHMKPAEDSPNQEAMDESHLMTNIAPQYGNHNQQAWRTLERAIGDLVAQTGGKAHIITGNLFLDKNGKPLPQESVTTTGSKDRKIGVPTHNFKTVLLELPNGNVSMFAYMVPNVKDGPSKKDAIVPMLESSRVPVDQLETLLGQDLYAQLPKSVQDKLEKDSKAPGAFQLEGSKYEAVTLLTQR